MDAPAPTTDRLHNSYPLWRPVVITTPLAVAVCVLIGTGTGAGRGTVVALIVAIWAAYLATRVALSRAAIETQGTALRVRRVSRWTELAGPQVTRVTQVLSPRGPNFRVATPDRPRGVLVPCALVHGGQSTLFTWLLTFAPAAELDAASTRTLELLERRGLVAVRSDRPTGPGTTSEEGNQEVGN